MAYPSDLTQEQFSKIEALLEGARQRTRPRKYRLLDIFNGVLYVLKTGCQWRAVPKDYPDYRTLHAYFRFWSKPSEGEDESLLNQALKKIGKASAYRKWKERQDEFYYRRFSKR
jgi:transposase